MTSCWNRKFSFPVWCGYSSWHSSMTLLHCLLCCKCHYIKLYFYWQKCPQGIHRYWDYSEVDFGVFHPLMWHVAPMSRLFHAKC